MVTSVATSTPQPRRREMHEVEAPVMFQFTDQHRTLSGKLVDISLVPVKDKLTGQDKETLQYMFEDEAGGRVTCLATYDLQRKIQPKHVGHFMWISYEGEDSSVKTQGSPLKKFRVQVSRDKEPD